MIFYRISKKRLSTFADVTQDLKDSEIFLNIQINDLTENFKRAKQLHSLILANGKETIQEFVKYKRDTVFQAIQNVFFKHSTNLHEMLKIVTKSDRHDITFSPNVSMSNATCTYDLNLAYIYLKVNMTSGQNSWTFMNLTYMKTLP